MQRGTQQVESTSRETTTRPAGDVSDQGHASGLEFERLPENTEVLPLGMVDELFTRRKAVDIAHREVGNRQSRRTRGIRQQRDGETAGAWLEWIGLAAPPDHAAQDGSFG